MAVETGNYIANLDPNAPADSEPVGESNEHDQLLKRVLVTTFDGTAGDRYDETSGPVKVGPVALNQLPLDVDAIATEIGLDLNNLGAETRIDDLASNAVRRDQPESIGQPWEFVGNVDFNTGAVSFTGIVPTIDGNAIAIADDIPSYYERSKLQVTSIGDGVNYITQPADLGKKIVFVGSAARTIEISGGVDDDTMLITNAGSAAGVVLTVTGAANEDFLGDTGALVKSFTITGRYKTVGLHKVNGAWQLSGDYD